MANSLSKEQKAGYAMNLNMCVKTAIESVGDLSQAEMKGKFNEFQRRQLALLGALTVAIATAGMIQLETADDNLVTLARN